MNQPQIQLCLVLHNHQPIGNFDGVFEAAYQDSYLPFLELFEPFEDIKISLHTSGPLMQWLQSNHPDYLNRVASLVEAGRVEIVGGAFYEPILPMIPTRDRVGQIAQFSKWLEERVCSKVNGMWIPERVWESCLTASIADAGIHYTVLDDFHFRRAGLTSEQLYGYYMVEDEGKLVRVFPGSEQLRYLIPFAAPEETIDYCRKIGTEHPGSVVVFGDDGEKFGTWPDTKKHVYENGWLKNFFQALTDNKDWLQTSTLETAAATTPPLGKIYLPDGSYREMTEWALPVGRQVEFDELSHQLESDPRKEQIRSFLGGGFWRNFKVKYPETNIMYSRMMYVSKLLEQATQQSVNPKVIDAARDHLYRGQCNCSYWHGAFGGIYLPHLRNAVFYHLLMAENLVVRAMGQSGQSGSSRQWVEATSSDYTFGGRQEIRLANEQATVWISPGSGGQIYEFDLMQIGHNLGATIQRRPELYHQKVQKGSTDAGDEAASIHDRVVFKQKDLDTKLQYDHRMRNSLIDHFWDDDVSVEQLMRNESLERGDFADGTFEAKIRRNPDRIQVMLIREGNAWGIPLKLTKGVTLAQGSSVVEIAYLIEGIPKHRELRFASEFNFAGLPEGLDDRFFSDVDGKKIGHFGEQLNLENAKGLSLTDQWLGLNLRIASEETGTFWAYPVQTVSQSESGFESVHQAVCVQPSWIISGDINGRWSNRMQITLETDPSKHPQDIESAVTVG